MVFGNNRTMLLSIPSTEEARKLIGLKGLDKVKF